MIMVKRYVQIFVFVCVCLFGSVLSFADSPSSSGDGTIVDPVIIEKTDLTDLIDAIKESSTPIIIEKENQEEPVKIEAKAAPVTPSTTNGFHNVIINLLGNYEPITVDYEYRTGSSTYTSHSITTAPDWSWIASAAIFGIVIFCVFRFLGGLFRRD